MCVPSIFLKGSAALSPNKVCHWFDIGIALVNIYIFQRLQNQSRKSVINLSKLLWQSLDLCVNESLSVSLQRSGILSSFSPLSCYGFGFFSIWKGWKKALIVVEQEFLNIVHILNCTLLSLWLKKGKTLKLAKYLGLISNNLRIR